MLGFDLTKNFQEKHSSTSQCWKRLSEYPSRIRSEIPQDVVPGDVVTLKLQGVDLWRRIGHFVHVPGGADGETGTP